MLEKAVNRVRHLALAQQVIQVNIRCFLGV